jgi:hypothetical protein
MAHRVLLVARRHRVGAHLRNPGCGLPQDTDNHHRGASTANDNHHRRASTANECRYSRGLRVQRGPGVCQECASNTYCVDDVGDGVYSCRPGCEPDFECVNIRAQLPSMSCRRVESTDGDLSSSRVCKAQSPAIIQDQVKEHQENPTSVTQVEPVPVTKSNATISDLQFGAGSHTSLVGPRISSQVDLGDVEIVGNEEKMTTQSSLDVLRVLTRYKSQLLYCYEKRLKQSPDLPPGVVVISVSISEGRTQSVAVSGNTTGDAELGDCIGKKFLLWRFHPDTEMDVTVPYLLTR